MSVESILQTRGVWSHVLDEAGELEERYCYKNQLNLSLRLWSSM